MQRANCLGLDPDLFFPEKGVNTAQAKAVCAGCVSRQECLDYALETPVERAGIWGGLAPRERQKLNSAGERQKPSHGTRSCYQGGCRRDECREANNAYNRRQRGSA